MPVIRQLDPHVADLIAAGEVVERPSSVLRVFSPSTKVLVLERAEEMSSSRFSRSLQTTSMEVG